MIFRTHRYDLKKYYDNKNIINQGIEGNTTEDVLERLQTGVYDYNVKKGHSFDWYK